MPTTNTIPKPADPGQNVGDNEAALEQHEAERRRRMAFDKRAGTPDGQPLESDRNGQLGGEN